MKGQRDKRLIPARAIGNRDALMTSHDRCVVFTLRHGRRAGGRSSERAGAARKAAGRAQVSRQNGESAVKGEAALPEFR
jgi:hypothetical protein